MLKSLLQDRTALKSIGFNIFVLAPVVCFYFGVTSLTQLRYIEWAESDSNSNSTARQPLPDIILDHIPASWNQNNAVGAIADLIPTVMLAIALIFLVLHRYIDIVNQFGLILAGLVLTNGIVENVTMMPASYGYLRCIQYLGLDKHPNGTHRPGPYRPIASGTFSPTGTCTAMMWSGHVQQTMMGVHFLISGCERRWPSCKRRICCLSVKAILVNISAVVLTVMLLCNNGHYSSDILVGYIVTSLTLGSDKIKHWCAQVNPFLPVDRRNETRIEIAAKKSVDVHIDAEEGNVVETVSTIELDFIAELEASSTP